MSLYNKEESKLFYSSDGGYADRKVDPFQDPGVYYVTLLGKCYPFPPNIRLPPRGARWDIKAEARVPNGRLR